MDLGNRRAQGRPRPKCCGVIREEKGNQIANRLWSSVFDAADLLFPGNRMRARRASKHLTIYCVLYRQAARIHVCTLRDDVFSGIPVSADMTCQGLSFSFFFFFFLFRFRFYWDPGIVIRQASVYAREQGRKIPTKIKSTITIFAVESRLGAKWLIWPPSLPCF